MRDQKKEQLPTEKRMATAAENLKKMQEKLGPYLRKPVVQEIVPNRKWEISDATITRAILRSPI